MRRGLNLLLSIACLALGPAALAQAPGRTRANPLIESSAGRAWQRITFGAIDCGAGLAAAADFCPQDAFSTSGVFVNGTYRDIRFVYAGEPAGTPSVADFLANRVIGQSQTFPTASTASGFNFTFKGGPTPVRETDLFGPLFGERGRTNGKGYFSVTLSGQRLRWDSLDGHKVRDVEVVNNSNGIGAAGLPWGDPDYLTVDGSVFGYVGRCEMNIDTWMFTASAAYGVSDRLDLSVSVPLIRSTVRGSNEFLDFVRFPDGAYSVAPEDTGFAPQGRFFVQGNSTGLGDVAVQGTYALVKGGQWAAALHGRVDLGTGSYDKMTGTGETRGRVGASASWGVSDVSPHATVSYAFGNDVLYDELMWVAGVDLALARNRVTLNAELVGRSLFSVQGFDAGRLRTTLRSPLTGDSFEVRDYAAARQDFNLFFVAGGVKWNVGGRLLAGAYLLVPFGDSGLQALRPSFNLGLNYVLGSGL